MEQYGFANVIAERKPKSTAKASDLKKQRLVDADGKRYLRKINLDSDMGRPDQARKPERIALGLEYEIDATILKTKTINGTEQRELGFARDGIILKTSLRTWANDHPTCR